MRDVPASCPRARDGAAGPRRCGELECDYHLLQLAGRGRAPEPWRRKVALAIGDTCVLDVAERHPDGLPWSLIAALLGSSIRGVRKAQARAFRKARNALAEFVEQT